MGKAVPEKAGSDTAGPGGEDAEQERANMLIGQAEEAIRKGKLERAAGIYREVLQIYKKLNREGASDKIVAMYNRLRRLYRRLAS